MANLSAALVHPWNDGIVIPCKMAAVKIWQGALVGIPMEITLGTPSDGYVNNLQVGQTNAWIPMGVAYETVDNSAGSAGGAVIECRVSGVARFIKTTAIEADRGRDAYVTDNQTVTVTGALKATRVGKIVGIPDSGHVDILIDMAADSTRYVGTDTSTNFPYYVVSPGG